MSRFRRVFDWIIFRIGHRGSFIAFLAILDILYGYSILADSSFLNKYNLIFPPAAWGLTWLIVGFFMVTGIFAKQDRVHFGVAAAMKVAWATLFVDLAYHHMPRAWVSIVIWACFAALVVVVSFWPEGRRVTHKGRDDTGPQRTVR